MLIFTENFNEYIANNLEGPFNTLSYYNGLVIDGSEYGDYWGILDGGGINGSKCFYMSVQLRRDHQNLIKFPIRPSKRVVLGFWLKSTDAQRLNYPDNYAGFGIVLRNSNNDNLLKIQSDNIIDTVTGYSYSNIEPADKNIYLPIKFTPIIIAPDDSIWSMTHNTTYPILPTGTAAHTFDNNYNFYEFFIDFQNADSNEGIVKLAINGIEYMNLTGVNNVNRHLWSSPGESAGYCNEVCILYEGATYSIDSIYTCNEEMGYHDDFLGPVNINTIKPIADGDQTNWLPYQDSEEVPEAANFESLQNERFDSDGSYDNYVEAISHGERDLFYYMPEFDTRFIDLKAVIHNIAYKNTYTTNDLDLLKAIVPISKASGNDIVQEKPYITRVNEFTYNLLQVPYSIFPSLATPWTWELLENGQFGYEFRTMLWTFIQDEQFDVAEELTKEHYRLHYPEDEIDFTEDLTVEVNP